MAFCRFRCDNSAGRFHIAFGRWLGIDRLEKLFGRDRRIRQQFCFAVFADHHDTEIASGDSKVRSKFDGYSGRLGAQFGGNALADDIDDSDVAALKAIPLFRHERLLLREIGARFVWGKNKERKMRKFGRRRGWSRQARYGGNSQQHGRCAQDPTNVWGSRPHPSFNCRLHISTNRD